MSRELENTKRLFAALMRKSAALFPVAGRKLEASRKQGVYVILDTKNRIVHVGRTLRAKNGIAQRLNNHLHAASSFTAHYLKGDGSRLRGKYRYKYVEVQNARARALLEAYAIANLCPKHLGLGKEPS
jgi:hypothetical protein